MSSFTNAWAMNCPPYWAIIAINNQDLITPSYCFKQHTINFFGGLSLILILCNLAACTPPTEQQRIDAVNQKIGNYIHNKP